MAKGLLLCGLFLWVLSSCSTKQTSKNEGIKYTSVDSLYTLVVAKHDEVMPKTADISKLSRILRSDLENLGEDKASTEKKERILELLSALQSGHDAMFDWMGEFKGAHTNKEFYEKSKENELLTYLKEEELKIERVAKLMLESIGNAEVYLQNNNGK
jgi:hypothetical protein